VISLNTRTLYSCVVCLLLHLPHHTIRYTLYSAFASLGIFYNDELSSGVAGDDPPGVTQVVVNLIDDTVGRMRAVFTPVQDIAQRVPAIVAQVILLLDNTNVLVSGTSGLVTRLNTLSNTFNNYEIIVRNETFECVYCKTIAQEVTDISNQISAQVTDCVYVCMCVYVLCVFNVVRFF